MSVPSERDLRGYRLDIQTFGGSGDFDETTSKDPLDRNFRRGDAIRLAAGSNTGRDRPADRWVRRKHRARLEAERRIVSNLVGTRSVRFLGRGALVAPLLIL